MSNEFGIKKTVSPIGRDAAATHYGYHCVLNGLPFDYTLEVNGPTVTANYEHGRMIALSLIMAGLPPIPWENPYHVPRAIIDYISTHSHAEKEKDAPPTFVYGSSNPASKTVRPEHLIQADTNNLLREAGLSALATDDNISWY